jgi:hypothetical protein
MASPESITVKDAVIQFLQSKQGEDFKPKDLANELKVLFPLRFQNKEPGQLAAEIGAGGPNWVKQNPQLRRSEDSPRKYWWESDVSEGTMDNGSTPEAEVAAQTEHDLYPLLAEYLISRHRRIYPKRIDEKTSSNAHGKDGNKWLHPDMVGLEDLASGWDYKMKQLSAKAGAKQAKLWSFEVKREVPRSKVREYYFQAVSNSTWANYGYLVTAKVKDDALAELRLLHEVHGIGVILLDPNNPADNSTVEIPARERPDVDWGTCNRIANENKDFLKYVKLIAQFHDTKETSVKDWDIPNNIALDD